MAAVFRIGDRVKLKSGSPPMTIIEVPQDGLKAILTAWFDGPNEMRSSFPPEALAAEDARVLSGGSHDLKQFFRADMWRGGGSETKSGRGSTLQSTSKVRPALEALFRRLKIKTLLDAPCGDFNWMQRVDLTGIRYCGLDIIDEIIADNVAKYSRDDREFHVADLTKDPLPAADLMLCRDCTFHLPIENVWQILENFAASGTRYLLLTTHTDGSNQDMPVPGSFRSRDFLAAPFNFVRPEPDGWIADHPATPPLRVLGLWTAEQVREALTKAGR